MDEFYAGCSDDSVRRDVIQLRDVSKYKEYLEKAKKNKMRIY